MKLLSSLLLTILLAGCTADNSEEQALQTDNKPAEEIINTEDENSEETAVNKSSTPSEPVEILKDERNGIIPERIEIPELGVDAPTDPLGLLDNGEMAVPESIDDTSWYEPGYKPGEPGNAVIAGHVSDTVDPGVFSELHTLNQGDEIIIHGTEGEVLTFTVFDKELYDADEAPVDKIFGYSHRSLLNLITCEGVYDYDAGGTPNRWVIYTELNSES